MSLRNADKEKKITGTVLTAVFAAVICVLSPLTLPFSPVPFSFSVFIICCVSVAIGKKAAVSVLLYIIIGAAGLPVFSAFTGGAGVIAGATGGFIIGYIPFSLIIGIASHKIKKGVLLYAVSAGALAVLYAFGAGWYAYTANTGLREVLTVSVFPFIIPDILKTAAGVFCGCRIKKALTRKNLGKE